MRLNAVGTLDARPRADVAPPRPFVDRSYVPVLGPAATPLRRPYRRVPNHLHYRATTVDGVELRPGFRVEATTPHRRERTLWTLKES